jgi:methionine synthase II (cobalamin-independent)
MAKHLRLHATWQEKALRSVGARTVGAQAVGAHGRADSRPPRPETIVFVDEPYLASFGSAYVAVERDQVVALLEEVFAGLQGLKGVHCCGNTDWSLLLSTSLDILNFDAHNFAETLALYPEAVKAFLRRGGLIAWGIVPVRDDAEVRAATAEGLTQRLEAALRHLASKGVPLDDLLNAALVTPACGLGTLSEPAAEQALALAAEVSRRMRLRYRLQRENFQI